MREDKITVEERLYILEGKEGWRKKIEQVLSDLKVNQSHISFIHIKNIYYIYANIWNTLA